MYSSDNLVGYILNNCNQVAIMAHFLEISEGEILYCLAHRNNRINSPIREDNNPSVGFTYDITPKGDKLRMRDFARPAYSGDLFDMAARSMNINIRAKGGFIQVCEYIINNQANFESKSKVRPVVRKLADFKLDVDYRKFIKQDIELWKSWGIDEIAMGVTNIYPFKQYYRDGVKSGWTDNAQDRGYSIELENGKRKLYFPFRDKHSKYPKFITNSFKTIDFYNLEDKGHKLLIMKSRKEVAFLYAQLLKYKYKMDRLKVVSLSSESVIPTTNIIKSMSLNYKYVYLLTDNDPAGMECSDRFGIIPNAFTFTPYLTIAKDLTDSYMINPKGTEGILKDILTVINNMHS